jgi:hypothetical protein
LTKLLLCAEYIARVVSKANKPLTFQKANVNRMTLPRTRLEQRKTPICDGEFASAFGLVGALATLTSHSSEFDRIRHPAMFILWMFILSAI